MRRSAFTLVTLAILVLQVSLSSCNGCSNEHKGDAEVAKIVEVPNKSYDAMLEFLEGDSMIVTSIETGERESLNFVEAKQEGRVLGSLTEGSLLSLLSEAGDSHKLNLAVNVSELEGQWFYDMHQHRGLVVEANGAISPINPQKLSFRDWKIHNGHLLFYYVDMQQVADSRDDYHGDVAELRSLSKEEMTIALHDTVLVCRRQHEVIKLRSASN